MRVASVSRQRLTGAKLKTGGTHTQTVSVNIIASRENGTCALTLILQVNLALWTTMAPGTWMTPKSSRPSFKFIGYSTPRHPAFADRTTPSLPPKDMWGDDVARALGSGDPAPTPILRTIEPEEPLHETIYNHLGFNWSPSECVYTSSGGASTATDPMGWNQVSRMLAEEPSAP